MKKIRKLMSIVLSIMIVISIMSIHANAELLSGTCGENLIWSYDESSSTLTISGTGIMNDYYGNTVPWNSYKENIKQIVFDGEITYIGNNAFNLLINLNSITIPDSVIKIGYGAFIGCEKLEKIIIPNNVSTIGEYIFYDCANLKSVTIGKGLTDISSHAFYNCVSLKSIEIPDNVTKIDNSAFLFCTGLENVSISKSLKEISESAFEYCRTLKEIVIPEKVETIGARAFANCSSLVEILVDKNNKYFCNDEYGVLYSKDYTLLIQYPAGGNETMYAIPYLVKDIEIGAFGGAQFSTLILSTTVETIGDWAFESCYYLKEIFIKNNLKEIGKYAFYDCHNLSNVYYSDSKSKWNNINIKDKNDYLNKSKIYYSYISENTIISTMSSQIRFIQNDDGTYANKFDIRTRVKISDIDFKKFVAGTNIEAEHTIQKVGFIYSSGSNLFSLEDAKKVAKGENIEGYIDVPVNYIQDADGYYMFSCRVLNIPESAIQDTVRTYAYICVNDTWYFLDSEIVVDFNEIYSKYYPIAAKEYNW